MNLRTIYISVVAAVIPLCCLAAPKTVTVSGESVFYDNGHYSRDECMRLAAEQARIAALAKEFGTIVSQDIVQTERISSNRESTDLLALSMTEVKGEWLGDTAEPKYDISMDPNGYMVVKCSVRGNAREISNQSSNFDTRVLRNGIYAKNTDNRFIDGDDMYLYFLGSEDGYLSVWLEDESRTVYGLLPYPRDPKGEAKVKKYKEYTFFNPSRSSGEFGPEEGLTLTAPDDVEYNRVYVVFSPNHYSRPPMSDAVGLPSLPSADFSKWLMKARRNDPRLGVKSINLEISPRN